METIKKYFISSLIFTLFALIGGYLLAGWQGVWIVAILSILETSLSFDNAVVNAKVLQHWDEKWKQRFITWGILVAVFGMRLVFPLVIVSVAAGIDPLSALLIAIYEQDKYAQTLSSAHIQIAAFGGAFLMMVFLKYFLDYEKDIHWLKIVETRLARLGKLESSEVMLSMLVIISVSYFFPLEERMTFIISGLWGIVTFIIVDGLGAFFEVDDGAIQLAKQGLAGFIYLEMLDASFSFDGVIGAFALSKNLFIIALGLGVGAMFVRSFTIMLVDKQTLTAYRYLEHGAFWAIGALAILMLIGAKWHIPETITGLIGAVLIGLSLWSSITEKQKLAVENSN